MASHGLAACLTHVGLAAALACAASPGFAQDSRYTELVGATCTFQSDPTRPGDLKVCRGVAGTLPETLAEHTRTHFALGFGGSRPPILISAWSFGTRIEWRGSFSTQRPEPHSAILRVLLKDPESAKLTADGQVLSVIRVDPGRKTACLAAVLDAARPDANQAARAAADRIGPSFRCGSDQPTLIGPATRWTAAVLQPTP